MLQSLLLVCVVFAASLVFFGHQSGQGGGLHGVGASVVNALSKELVATVKRDGAQWEMRFRQGKPTNLVVSPGR